MFKEYSHFVLDLLAILLIQWMNSKLKAYGNRLSVRLNSKLHSYCVVLLMNIIRTLLLRLVEIRQHRRRRLFAKR